MSDHVDPSTVTDFFDGFHETAPDGAYLSVYGLDGLSFEIGVLRPSGKRLARQLRAVALEVEPLGPAVAKGRCGPVRLEEWEWSISEAFEKGRGFGARLAEALASGADFVLDP